MKRSLMAALGALLTIPGFAQEVSGTQSFASDPFNHPLLPFYAAAFLILVVIILVAWVAFYVYKVLNMLTRQADEARAEKLGVAYVPRPSLWEKFMQTANASVPVTEEKQIELDHNFDGIKELDNHLPPWWKWLFYGTIGWSAVYMVLFHVTSSLPLSGEEYQIAVAQAEEQSRKLMASRPQAQIDENALAFSADSLNLIASGKTVFMDNNCGSCHGSEGGGNTIGPNLTDQYWLHGGHIKSVFSTIRNGVVEKGMPAWGRSLSPTQVRDVTFFILSLQGTQPQNAKAPQGTLYQEASILSDSTKTQASL